jgi:hypothetical protein
MLIGLLGYQLIKRIAILNFGFDPFLNQSARAAVHRWPPLLHLFVGRRILIRQTK